MTRHDFSKLIYVLVCLFLLFICVIRPVNYDEAYYLASGQEILNGSLPYVDFLFHQMPLSIFIFAPISDYGIKSLFLGRLLSALFLFASYFFLRKLSIKYSKEKKVFLFTVLFFSNCFMLDWVILIKIYSISIFLLSGAIYCYDNLKGDYKTLFVFLAGIIFSLLIFVKIIFLINLLIFLVFLSDLIRIKRIFYFAAVTCSIILPVLIFLMIFGKNLDEVYFNIFDINFITKKNIDASFSVSLLKFACAFLLPQNLILLFIIVVSGFKYSSFEKFLLANIAGFILIHFFSRMLMEYVSSVIPLLILLSFLRFDKFEVNVLPRFKFLNRKKLSVILISLYILLSPFSIEHFKHIFEKRNLNLSPMQLYYLEERINLMPGDKILSSWEGYSIFSKKIPLMKQYYGSAFIDEFVGEKDKKKYGIASKKDYEDLIISKVPDIIAYDSSNNAHLGGLESLIAMNYVPYIEYHTIVVYRKQ